MITIFRKPGCLSDVTLDVLVLASHRLHDAAQASTLNHLRECAACRTRCVARANRIVTPETMGVLQPEGWNLPVFGGSAPRFSGVAANVAAVGILGVALLSPLFLRQAAVVATARPQATETPLLPAPKSPSLQDKILFIQQVRQANRTAQIKVLKAQLVVQEAALAQMKQTLRLELMGQEHARIDAEKSRLMHSSDATLDTTRIQNRERLKLVYAARIKILARDCDSRQRKITVLRKRLAELQTRK